MPAPLPGPNYCLPGATTGSGATDAAVQGPGGGGGEGGSGGGGVSGGW